MGFKVIKFLEISFILEIDSLGLIFNWYLFLKTTGNKFMVSTTCFLFISFQIPLMSALDDNDWNGNEIIGERGGVENMIALGENEGRNFNRIFDKNTIWRQQCVSIFLHLGKSLVKSCFLR